MFTGTPRVSNAVCIQSVSCLSVFPIPVGTYRKPTQRKHKESTKESSRVHLGCIKDTQNLHIDTIWVAFWYIRGILTEK